MSPPPGRALSELARDLLRAERSASEPEALKQRALSRARVAFETERASRSEIRSAPPAPLTFQRRRGVRVVFGAAAALAVAGLAAASADWWQPSISGPPASRLVRPSVRALPQPTPRSRSAPPQEITELRPPAPSSRLSVRPPSTANALPDSTKPPMARQYAQELAVLEPARSAVARGDFAKALAAASEHQREFPNGLLAEERSALRVRALWGLGRIGEADAAAAAFRQRYPRSALLAWMRQKTSR